MVIIIVIAYDKTHMYCNKIESRYTITSRR